jgi:hypothetical protein
MPKKVYVVKGYEDKGKQFRRTTDREYTHAVLLRNINEGFSYVVGYCGRPDLAEKLKVTTLNNFDRNNRHLEVEITIHEVVRIK